MRENGVAATRVVLQLAWVYAAAAERRSDPGQLQPEERAPRAPGNPEDRSTPESLQAFLAQTARRARLTIGALSDWLTGGWR